jgi:enoyl-CoA hydratase/carnithine racemase
MADEILCEVQNNVATLTMNRPEKRNALNSVAITQLITYLHDLETNPAVRVIVLRGAGKAFSAGRDLRELGQQQLSTGTPPPEITEVFHSLEVCRHPTIAMVHGDAVAGGCELALHCDLRLMADQARMSMPLARLGLMVPYDLTVKLVQVIGPSYTRQLLFTAQPFDGTRAYEIGMVHQVHPATELEDATYAMAQSIAANAPLSLAGMKKTLLRATSLMSQIEHADLDAMVKHNRLSEDAKEGVRAQMEKRPPVFQGR